MFQGFVTPLLVWGTALAAVPLLIHLFNRQRHKPLEWAAMKYMIAAYKKTRRRAPLENLILLLLRMAAVALLALALARPFTGSDSPLASLTESRRDMVLVLDASASTGYRENVQSVHEAIVDRARKILEDFDGTRGDRVRLVAASSRPRLVSARAPSDALALLSTLAEPTDEPLDLASTLAEVASYAEEEAAGTSQSQLEVRLLTDLQRRSFEPAWAGPDVTGAAVTDAGGDAEPAEPAAAAMAAALDRLDELGVRVVVEDLGATQTTPPNLGVEAVAPIGDILGPGLASEIGVAVRNFGPEEKTSVRVALEVDGVRQPSLEIDVPGRASAEAVFRVPFPTPGEHTLVAHLEGDRLAVDDSRAAVVRVPASIRVLLVNGDPHPTIDRDEVGYLKAVLEPPDDDSIGMVSGAESPFTTRVVDAVTFGVVEQDLSSYDVLVLANVNSVSARVVETIEAFTAGGGVVLFTMGDRTADSSAIDALNTRFWNATGTGLLPAKLFRAVEVASRRDAYYRCTWFDEEHPSLRFFADERWRPYLTEVPVYGFVATEPIANARVLARLDDEDKSPLLVERPFGRGRVLLWSTSIDRGWSRVADSPNTLIPLMHELLRYATSGQTPLPNVAVGDAINLEVDGFPRTPFVVRPDATRQRLDGEASEVTRGIWALPAITSLDRAGLWSVEHDEGVVPFAVGIDTGEGDLDRIGADELEGQHRAWRVYDAASGEAADEDDDPERGELWRPLALAALLALVAETLWAAWIGRGRRIA